MKAELDDLLAAIKAQGVSVTLHTERPRKPHRCPVCGGSGRVPGSLYEGPANGATAIDPATTSCRTCKGTGVLWG